MGVGNSLAQTKQEMPPNDEIQKIWKKKQIRKEEKAGHESEYDLSEEEENEYNEFYNFTEKQNHYNIKSINDKFSSSDISDDEKNQNYTNIDLSDEENKEIIQKKMIIF